MSDKKLRFLTIRELHQGYEAGDFKPSEVTQSFLEAISKDKTNSYITVLKERALHQAKECDTLLVKEKKIPASKPLFGIPIGIKDLLVIDGVKTTCASKILENYIPPYTATSVQKLEAAGAISLGKLNMDEFAMGSSNESSAFGAVQHPTHPGRVPGGSSGGSAAAVKAGLCTVSLGTDTGGSIRLPGSYCGVVGIKPTYGRVSRFGLIAFASSLDQIGPLAHTVEDAVRVLDILSGHDPLDSTSAPVEKSNWLSSLTSQNFSLKGLRIGKPKQYFIDGIHPEVRKSVEKTIKWYTDQGAEIIDVDLPHSDYALATYYIVAVSEASSNLARFDGVRFAIRPKSADQAKSPADFYKKVRALFGSEVKRRIILGTYALSSGYYDAYYKKACQVRQLIKKDFEKAFEKVDVLMSPVAPTTAFPLGEKTEDPLTMYLNDILTIPASLAGLPCLSLPCGQDQAGLPIGVQMIAPQFGDEKLFQVAQAFDKNGRES